MAQPDIGAGAVIVVKGIVTAAAVTGNAVGRSEVDAVVAAVGDMDRDWFGAWMRASRAASCGSPRSAWAITPCERRTSRTGTG